MRIIGVVKGMYVRVMQGIIIGFFLTSRFAGDVRLPVYTINKHNTAHLRLIPLQIKGNI